MHYLTEAEQLCNSTVGALLEDSEGDYETPEQQPQQVGAAAADMVSALALEDACAHDRDEEPPLAATGASTGASEDSPAEALPVGQAAGEDEVEEAAASDGAADTLVSTHCPCRLCHSDKRNFRAVDQVMLGASHQSCINRAGRLSAHSW